MLNKIKSELKEASQYLDELVDSIEEKIDHVADESRDLWRSSQLQRDHIKNKLFAAEQALEKTSGDTALQAHLALMEARDYWQCQKEILDSFVQHLKNRMQYPIDHAVLQGHLAKMESSDVVAEALRDLERDFTQSTVQIEHISLNTVESIKEYCKKVAIASSSVTGEHH